MARFMNSAQVELIIESIEKYIVCSTETESGRGGKIDRMGQIQIETNMTRKYICVHFKKQF